MVNKSIENVEWCTNVSEELFQLFTRDRCLDVIFCFLLSGASAYFSRTLILNMYLLFSVSS